MKWSQEHVDLATDIVNAAPSRMVGYNLAANAIGTTETAVRCLMQRIDGARPVQRKADRGDHDELAVHKLRTQVTDLQAAKILPIARIRSRPLPSCAKRDRSNRSSRPSASTRSSGAVYRSCCARTYMWRSVSIPPR